MYLQGPYNYQAVKSAGSGPHWAMMMSSCKKKKNLISAMVLYHLSLLQLHNLTFGSMGRREP